MYFSINIFCFCSDNDDPPIPPQQDRSHPAPSVPEMSSLIIFLLDVLPLVNKANTHTHAPLLFSKLPNKPSEAKVHCNSLKTNYAGFSFLFRVSFNTTDTKHQQLQTSIMVENHLQLCK